MNMGFKEVITIVALGLVFVSQSYADKKYSLQQQLNKVMMQTVSDLNADLPMMVDKITRLNNTIYVSNELHYNYTITDGSLDYMSDSNKELFKLHMMKQGLGGYCHNPDVSFFRDYGISWVYNYTDSKDKWVLAVKMSPQDCTN